ncbi:MAG: sensor histidine kinase [Pirellulales bacterium]
MSIAELRRIGALLREQRHVLLARWRRQVRQLPSAEGLDVPSLNDHMPLLIDELATALEKQPEEAAEQTLMRGSPPIHGRQRLHDGFNVEEVVAEYNVLRSCVHDLAEEHGMIIHGADLRVVNRIIDEAIGLAVQTYATQLSLEIKRHRDQHIAFVANDLRTPLQAISLTVRVIEQALTHDGNNPQSEKLLKVLRRNIQHLEQSVVEVIKSKSDSPTGAGEKMECRRIDLWPVVENVVASLEPVITASSVDLVNDVPTDLQVFADASLLARAAENTLAFAISSAPRGTVRVSATDAGARGVCCTVQHSGAPLSREALANLLGARAATEATSEPVGLGMPIVKQLIEAHGGHVSVRSNEAEGTRFELFLPVER